MFQTHYEEVARFAAEGELALDLQRAKVEYTSRTGEMFETDPSFERRIAAFLEWYVLDRRISSRPDFTPAQLFCTTVAAGRPEADQRIFADLTRTRLTLLEFRRAKDDKLHATDLLSKEKLVIAHRGTFAGLASGDIIAARLVTCGGVLMMSDVYDCHPREGRRAILKVAKRYCEQGGGHDERVALVHRIAFLTNRCERYKHVNPKSIFAELLAKAA